MDDQQSRLRNDPRYKQAYSHLQAGRWDNAISLLDELLQDNPGDTNLQRALEGTRLKAQLDSTSRIRAKRWQVPWRRVIFRILATTTILAVIGAGIWIVTQGVLPALSQARVERNRAQLLSEAKAYLVAEELDKAEANFQALLLQVPDQAEALEGLAKIQGQRAIQELYMQGVAAQDAGDWVTAVNAFEELAIKSPGYRDISSRMAVIATQQQVGSLYAEAEEAFSTGLQQEALDKYLQIQTLSVNFKTVEITERLFTIYMRLGRELVEKRPSSPSDIALAVNYFTKALVYKPRDPGALQEQHFADLFTKGQTAYQNAQWHDASLQLQSLYNGKADYLGTIVQEMLYDALIRSGDLYLQESDIYRAYAQYLSASYLPVPDTTLAKGRLAQVSPEITPSPTPAPTATPRPTSKPSSGGSGGGRPTAVQPTITPTPSPTPFGIAGLVNRIVFRSSNPGQTGLWVMDPDGSDRQYLGNSADLLQQYDDLVRKYQYAPDLRSMVYVVGPNDSAQLYITSTTSDSGRQVTNSLGASYDPSWSPDGTRILFVSQDSGSDDIWLMAADGSNKVNLSPNNYYDKHPSWSPDGSLIAFWSNRAGVKQIFLMGNDGTNVRNISNSPWDEYDPIWIR